MLERFTLSEKERAHKDLKFKQLEERYKDYSDPWGFNLNTVKQAMDVVYPLYKRYFRVRVFGLEHVAEEPYMVISNHTGQVPIDGMLIATAFATELDKPRVVHSMIERFMAGLPFLGDISAQAGSILGDRENCKWLLNKGESILVFPEGVRGINKSTQDFYKLQRFSHGFYRIALQSQTKILPISVIGAEEMFPFVFQAGGIGKKFGLPSLPITANLVPLPSPIDIYIGEPIEVPNDLSPEAPDKEIRPHVYNIEKIIKRNIHNGLQSRRKFFEWVRNPINILMNKTF